MPGDARARVVVPDPDEMVHDFEQYLAQYPFLSGKTEIKGQELRLLLNGVQAHGAYPQDGERLIIGTDEENGWRDLPRYFEQEGEPTMGFSPDGAFPVVNGEKAFQTVQLRFPSVSTGDYILRRFIADETVAILTHIDIVPAGDGWLRDPFKPEILDGLYFGRGAADMKADLMSAYYAMKYLADHEIKLTRKIHLVQDLNQIVKISSILDPNTQTELTPFGTDMVRALAKMEELAARDGFRYGRVDNMVTWIEYGPADARFDWIASILLLQQEAFLMNFAKLSGIHLVAFLLYSVNRYR
ncbi:M20/M25/M40 family metallo-hydrolase [Weissella confusa]|uniref:M20/M25/M40 family metallo-hydrolase n=1 Tax=Weissella confusa TaxID=1583 RepID=A0A923SST1_WEICO|nr:M20/M25/M40 family metallo-hydrolase [Weissella confusa]